MRLDKYLKASGLAKRRTVAKKLCDAGRVKIGDRAAKAGNEVRVGDVIEVRFGGRGIVVEVIALAEHPVGKAGQAALYQVKRELRFA